MCFTLLHRRYYSGVCYVLQETSLYQNNTKITVEYPYGNELGASSPSGAP